MAIRSLFGSRESQSPGTGTLDFTLPKLQNQPVSQAPSTPLRGNLFGSNTGNVLSGLQAGQSTPVGQDIGTSLLSGALSAGAGFLAGGPVGAIAGGVSSLLNSFLSVRKENKRKRQQKAFIKEIEAKRAKEKAQNRSDQLLQLQFNRKDTERNQAINAVSTKRQLLLNAINSNPILKQRFIQTGVR